VNSELKVGQGFALTWILLPGLVEVKEGNLLTTTDPKDVDFILDAYLKVMYCCDTRKFFLFNVTAWYNRLRTNSRVGRGIYCIQSFPGRFSEDNGICPHWPALSELTRLGMCTENAGFKDIRNSLNCPSISEPLKVFCFYSKNA
jgi:hypothetical protein